jgi:hypothetical protein
MREWQHPLVPAFAHNSESTINQLNCREIEGDQFLAPRPCRVRGFEQGAIA